MQAKVTMQPKANHLMRVVNIWKEKTTVGSWFNKKSQFNNNKIYLGVTKLPFAL